MYCTTQVLDAKPFKGLVIVMEYCTALHCTVLHTALSHTVLPYTVLHHPRQVQDAKPFKGLVIVMEYCDAGTLGDAIRGSAFSSCRAPAFSKQPKWPAIYHTLLEVALALRCLHTVHLVHRDLKVVGREAARKAGC